MAIETEEPKGLIARLEKIDRRVIFVLIGLSIVLPLYAPWKLELSPIAPITDFQAAIDALKPGDKVAVADDWDPGSKAELQTASVAVLHHLFSKDLKVIDFTQWATGVILVNETLERVAAEHGKKYGEDYCFLGFKEGREVIMTGAAENLRTTYPKDYGGKALATLPIMDGINSLRDVKLLITVSAGYPGTKEWVQQVQRRFNIPMIAICNGVSEPEYQPYYASGQLGGLVGGLANIAEYENLIGRPGFGMKSMVAQSSGHYMLAALIFLGNFFYAAARRKRALAIGIAVVGCSFFLLMFVRILS